jgi:hypothetical protein
VTKSALGRSAGVLAGLERKDARKRNQSGKDEDVVSRRGRRRSETLSLALVRRSAALLFALFAWFGLACAFAQPTMQTILTNGPASNRLNIVFLSEGYTNNELGQFSIDATNALKALLSHEPYRTYSNYFNAFTIAVASTNSGSSHYGITNNTYFHSAYDTNSDRLITIPPNFQYTNYSDGQGKVDALLQTFMPNCQLPILLVNDRYNDGGSDGFDKTAIAAVSYQLPEILTHETGHVLANLGDEYTNAYPGFPDTEEPNTTRQTNRALIKWSAWISTNTPIPTPPTSPYSSVVGLFEGAHYYSSGWYRPKLNCLMRANYAPFCDVCSEALVLAFYQRVRPVDSYSPASTNFSVSTTQALTFSLTLLQPATNTLGVQWYTNNTAVTGATNVTYVLSPQSFPNGTNWVSALVRDNTPLVRNDPTNLLSQTVTWTVNVSLPYLLLDSPLSMEGGKFAFRVTGNAPLGFVILGSSNLYNWPRLATNSLVGGQFWYTNSAAGSFPCMFYRATTPP